MELLSRNVYWTNMERDIRKYCNECNKCQQTKAPRHAKHGLLHQLEMACKPCRHISTDFITDFPESEGARDNFCGSRSVYKDGSFYSFKQERFTNGSKSIFGECLEISRLTGGRGIG